MGLEVDTFRATGVPRAKEQGRGAARSGRAGEDPFFQVNQFSWQDTNGWKDLNSKFVLMVYRDYVLTGSKDKEFLKYTWPAIQEAMTYLGKFDRDGDGIPENDGYPDQTYDEWVVRGDSAYCGSLWLAALRAAEEIGKALGDTNAAANYQQTVCARAEELYRQAVEWRIFPLRHRERIQRQYSGRPACRAVVREHDRAWATSCRATCRAKALKKIYDYNVMKFAQWRDGRGEWNGGGRNVDQDQRAGARSVDGNDAGLAGFMLGEGMKDEGIPHGVGNLSRDL